MYIVLDKYMWGGNGRRGVDTEDTGVGWRLEWTQSLVEFHLMKFIFSFSLEKSFFLFLRIIFFFSKFDQSNIVKFRNFLEKNILSEPNKLKFMSLDIMSEKCWSSHANKF